MRVQSWKRIVERKTNSQCKQEWQKQNLFHPRPGMQFTLGTNIKNGYRSRCCEEDRNIDKQSTEPPTLRSSGRGMQKHTQQSEQQVGEVGHQLPSGFALDRERKAAAPDGGQ